VIIPINKNAGKYLYWAVIAPKIVIPSNNSSKIVPLNKADLMIILCFIKIKIERKILSKTVQPDSTRMRLAT
jgi:hypothetical protein